MPTEKVVEVMLFDWAVISPSARYTVMYVLRCGSAFHRSCIRQSAGSDWQSPKESELPIPSKYSRGFANSATNGRESPRTYAVNQLKSTEQRSVWTGVL